jgi:LEA14-like dessication related protein
MRKLLWLLPLLSGCALLRSAVSSAFEKPTIAFREAHVASMDFQGAELDLVFAVTNPNSMGLDLTRAAYALDVEGHRVVSGMPQNGLVIPGHATTNVVFPANIRWTEIAPAIQALFAQDAVHYKAAGSIGIDSPIGLIDLPVEHEGTFASPRMPQFDVGSPRIESLSLVGARLAVPLTISNPNDFPVPIAGILGDVELAGAKVGRVAMPERAPVPVGGKTTLMIPLDVSFLSAGAAAAQAIRTGVAEVKIDAMLNAAGATLPFKIAKTVELQRPTGSAGP